MPNHRTHDLSGFIIAPIITAFATQITTVTNAIIFGAIFITCNLFITPDLDLNSRINRRWGILRFIWYPYRILIKHRSWLSHSGPLSASIRLFYLWCLMLPFVIFSYDTVQHFVLAVYRDVVYCNDTCRYTAYSIGFYFMRFIIVSGKTLEDITNQLNADDAEYGRIVYMEKTRAGYKALIDTWLLVVTTPDQLDNDEEQVREHNREWLNNLDMDNAVTI